ncbi:MAG: C40 family peptidase [Muribaculaceae bacterium]|nr:C40 family peptidase [Muribaculaceae bacterium]MEE1297142.1 C40 family peptidase [Muribaculaceae bacterium]
MAVSRKIFALFIMALVMVSFSVPAVAQLPVKKPGTIKEQIANSTLFNGDKLDKDILDILDYASKFKGTRYLLGATGPNRFDCSGFTSYVFSKFGYRLQRTSREQVNDGKVIAKNELKPGDLVFFNGRRAGGSRIGHVGIVTSADNENGTFEFIHASCSKGVTVSKSTEAYFDKRYVKACRVIYTDVEEAYGADLLIDFGIAKQEDYLLYGKQ